MTTMTVTAEPERKVDKPGRWELALRTCVLYQLWRFLWLNLRMLRIARMSHT